MAIREVAERKYVECDEAVKHSGLVLTRTEASATGKAGLVDADKELPMGVTVRSTEDPFNPGTYLTGQLVAYQDDGEADLVLANDNAEITYGDPIMAVLDSTSTPEKGVVDKLTIRTDSIANHEADLKAIVGIAKEFKAALAGATYGTTVKVKLTLNRGA